MCPVLLNTAEVGVNDFKGEQLTWLLLLLFLHPFLPLPQTPPTNPRPPPCAVVTHAVLTSDGCISFVDLEASCVAGQLQLTAPGCRALSFSTEPRANAMAVVCSDGLVRLFDLAAVRAKQQGQGQGQRKQLQQLHQQQLLQVSTSADVLPVLAGAQPGASRVLSNVSNIDHTGKAPAKANAASRRAGQSTPAQLHVRQLSGPAAALNRRKLQDMLRAFGEFPSRYRQLIW